MGSSKCSIQSFWIIMARQHFSPEVTVKGLRSAVYPMQWMGLMVICCGMALQRIGMLGRWSTWPV